MDPRWPLSAMAWGGRLGFSARDWGPVMAVRAANLAPKPVVSDKAFGFAEKEFLVMERDETSIY